MFFGDHCHISGCRFYEIPVSQMRDLMRKLSLITFVMTKKNYPNKKLP